MIFVNDLQTYFNSREAIFKHVGLKYNNHIQIIFFPNKFWLMDWGIRTFYYTDSLDILLAEEKEDRECPYHVEYIWGNNVHRGCKYTAIYLGKTDGAEYLAFFDSDKELKLTKKQLAELQLKY